MKKTQRLEAIRAIRRSWVSWLSIIIIALLAATAYLGILYSAKGLTLSAEACLNAQNCGDITVSACGLLSARDVEKIRGASGVTDAEGILSVPSRVCNDETCRDIRLQTLPERLNRPRLLEGRFAETAGECAVEQALADEMGYAVGSQITLSAGGGAADRIIAVRTYTVTGIFTTAEHMSNMISFEPTLLVSREAFNTRLIGETAATAVLVRVGEGKTPRFGAEWEANADRAKADIEAMNDGWAVMDLRTNAGYLVIRNNAENLNVISLTFSMLFILIAALVIYSTIDRLIGQESRLVGASKAMGLRNGEILSKYLLFGVSGTLTGVVLGILIAYFIFERLILVFFGTVLLFEERVMSFLPLPTAIVAGSALLLAVLAVALACGRLLKSTAVELMKGRSAGLHKQGGSDGGMLYLRLILRNMRTDRKRILVSIASIAGCCMLMMIGFSLKYAISRVPERQYGGIMRCGAEVAVDPAQNANAAEEVGEILRADGLEGLPASTRNAPFEFGGESGEFRLICTDRRDISDFFLLEDIGSGAVREIPERGLLICRRFAEYYGVKAGDPLIVYDSAMRRREMTVAGVVENYLEFPAFCSLAYAEESLGEAAAINTVFVRAEGGTEALGQRLSGVTGYLACTPTDSQREMFDGFSMILNLVILLLGGMAFMIACFILLNLVATYVNNKKTELTIMRINGYTTGETIRFASLESYATTLLGIIIGLFAGNAMGSFIIRQVEQPSIQFARDAVWISFAASAGITAAISWVIHSIAFRKIRSLKLSDLK